jgi:hypothetical protein
VSWQAWWAELQPSWRRRPVMPHSRTLPDGPPLFPEIKTGRNGVVTVVLTLVWILSAHTTTPRAPGANDLMKNIQEAMEDVTWVLTIAAKGLAK